MLRDKPLIHKPRIPGPVLARPAQHIAHLKPLRIIPCKRIQLRPQQDIVLGVVRIQQRDARVGVGGVFADRPDELVHGGDACAAGDHADAFRVAARVLHCALGAADVDRAAGFHLREVLRHRAGGVDLDQQLDAAAVAIVGDGRVGACDGGAVDGGAERDVLAGWEAEGVVCVRQGEDEVVDVRGDLGFVRESEGSPLARVEGCSSRGGEGVGLAQAD